MGSSGLTNTVLNLVLCLFLLLNWSQSILERRNFTSHLLIQISVVLLASLGILIAIQHGNPINETLTSAIKFLILIGFLKFLKNSEVEIILRLRDKLIFLISISGVVSGIELVFHRNILLPGAGSLKLIELGRYSGFFSWQNIATICHSLCLIFLVSQGFQNKSRRKIFLTIGNIVGLISSASLSGLLGLFISVLYLQLKKRDSRKYIYPFTVLSIMVTLTTSSVIIDRLKQAFGSDLPTGDVYVSNNSLEWRLIQWRFVLKKIMEESLFGYGFGSSTGIAEFNGYLSHNSYLTLFLEFGIVGFSVIFFISIFAAREYLRKIPLESKISAISIYICLGVSGIAENLPNQVAIYLLAPILLFVSKSTDSREQKV